MPLEIERKFLVKDSGFKDMASHRVDICQGYLSRVPERTVRVRRLYDKGFITVKSKNTGAVRHEFEYQVPVEDALEMLRMCEPPIIEKSRYIVEYDGLTWEVDEFHGAKEGLIVAEVELQAEDQTFNLPPFIDKEVTGDPAYYNSNLG